MLVIWHAACDLVGFPRHRIPVLTYLKYAKTPVVGVAAPLSIKSRNAESAILEVFHEDGTTVYKGDVPTNFVRSIGPRSTAPMIIKLTLDPRLASSHIIDPVEHELVVPVRQNPPKLGLRVPLLARALENCRIGWSAPRATKVAIEIDDGAGQKRLETHPTTAFFHTFLKPGRNILRFIARDQHSMTAAIRTVWVRPPKPPRIKIENSILCERIGHNVSFMWSIRNADEAWIEALFGNERRTIPLTGSLIVAVTSITQEFILAARGPGGLRRARLKAVPWIGLESNNA